MGWSPFRDAKTRAVWFAQLWEKQQGRCALCGFRFAEPGELNEQIQAAFSATFDHIVPRRHGGPDSLENFQLAHGACNGRRGDETQEPRPPVGIPRALKQLPVVRAQLAPEDDEESA